MAATAISAATAPDAQRLISAAVPGYNILHGSAEQVQRSAATTLPASLRIVEEITRPLTVVEAVMGSPAMAYGMAADKASEAFGDEEEEHIEETQNSAGDLTDGHLGSMDVAELKSMQAKISAALRARGELSAGGTGTLEAAMGGGNKTFAASTKRWMR